MCVDVDVEAADKLAEVVEAVQYFGVPAGDDAVAGVVVAGQELDPGSHQEAKPKLD